MTDQLSRSTEVPSRWRPAVGSFAVSTRKLILAALLCGLAIMLAGGIKLFQTVSSDEEVAPLSLGTSATLGDMTVSVSEIDTTGSTLAVTVSMVGVEGADPEQGWGVFVAGDSAIRMPVAAHGEPGAGAEPPCRGQVTSVASVLNCRVFFQATTGTPTVIYKRATLTQRWSR